jgi:hypothetical protein
LRPSNRKKTAAYIAGRSAPPEKHMGHAEAIIMGETGTLRFYFGFSLYIRGYSLVRALVPLNFSQNQPLIETITERHSLFHSLKRQLDSSLETKGIFDREPSES